MSQPTEYTFILRESNKDGSHEFFSISFREYKALIEWSRDLCITALLLHLFQTENISNREHTKT